MPKRTPIVPQPEIYGGARAEMVEGQRDQVDSKGNIERNKVVSVLVFLMAQSYVYTLIVMMVSTVVLTVHIHHYGWACGLCRTSQPFS